MNSSLLLFAAAAAVVVASVGASAVYPAVALHSPVTTQYHSQDELGQYAYGYSGGPSAKHEQRTADGVTRGGYSYVDANGLVQSLAYVSDSVNGFRVSGTNLPADTASAPVAPVVHAVPAVAAVPEPSVVDARLLAPAPVQYAAAPAPLQYAAAPAPLHYAAAPAAVQYAAAPAAIQYAAAPAPLHYAAAPAAVHYAAAPALLKISKPLTPAGTTNVHYPEHAVLLAARKKRSAGLYPYPLLSAYAAAPAPAHVVTVKHTEFAAPPAPVLHHLAAPYVLAPAAPAPVATSYTSVVRHDAAVPAPAPVFVHAAPAPAPLPVLKQYAAVPAPVEVVVPHVAVAPVKSQFHAQDEHGQYTYGYTDGASAKSETRYADGETRGSYSYVDDHGAVQAVHYSAGAEGFKAAGTNIPVHHV